MSAIERRLSIRGARFYDDGELMFVNHLDGSTRDGPRIATDADKQAHPGAFRAYVAAPTENPLTPLVSFRDPPDGPPPKEPGPYARKRAEAER